MDIFLFLWNITLAEFCLWANGKTLELTKIQAVKGYIHLFNETHLDY